MKKILSALFVLVIITLIAFPQEVIKEKVEIKPKGHVYKTEEITLHEVKAVVTFPVKCETYTAFDPPLVGCVLCQLRLRQLIGGTNFYIIAIDTTEEGIADVTAPVQSNQFIFVDWSFWIPELGWQAPAGNYPVEIKIYKDNNAIRIFRRSIFV